MELSKRSLVIFCLGWATSLLLAVFSVGCYYVELEREKQRSVEYAEMYNNLVQNYTKLLNEYSALVEQYAFEGENLTELLEEYERCIIRVNICIDYGNGTATWHNGTVVPLGCNLLNATKQIATVNCTYYWSVPGYFVDAINEVWNEGSYYWMWYQWTPEDEKWKYGPTGADSYILRNNETVKWRYEIPNYS
ncbi:MAG: hypothetical protein QW270_07675 [Candidatus Bathyarchaeia archaeon]